MAVLGQGQIRVLHIHGEAEAVGLFAVRNVNTGDTLDMSVWFSQVKYATACGGTKNNVKGSLPCSGSVVTVDSANLVGDAFWLTAWGVPSY